MIKIRWLLLAGFAFLGLVSSACATPEGVAMDEVMIGEKVSGQLLSQVTLRQAQISQPTAERLRTMQQMGMNVDNLAVQRVFIHLAAELTPTRISELEALGITLYPDSWLPPAGSQPTGFLLADMPVDKLAALTMKDYVIRVETAERELQPQKDFKPQ